VGLLTVWGQAAKMRDCKTIIAVDRFPSRLALAKKLGATHVIDTTGFTELAADLAKAITEATGGVGTSVSIDATGNVQLIKGGLNALGMRGQMVTLGIAPPGSELNVDLSSLLLVCMTSRLDLEMMLTLSRRESP
jgi:threonine dehydrogenase-like Zn-dependent dehydrogenase